MSLPSTCISVLVVLILASQTAAQTFQGIIRGTVRDADGPIASASAILENVQTGVRRRTGSNHDGGYSFPALEPGSYVLTVTHPGFHSFSTQVISIATQTQRTIDIVLDAATMTETVNVTAPSRTLETGHASVSWLLDGRSLNLLPMATRNPLALALTMPTVQSAVDARTNRLYDQSGTSRVSLGGGGVRANEYLLDGMPLTELSNRAVLIPATDMLEDIRVQLHAYDAEVGRTGGGVFNATARSGTNVPRGSVFALLRPGGWVEDNFFDAIRDLDTNDQQWSAGGGGVGGPLIRDRLFFWAAGESNRDWHAQSRSLFVPTQAMRAGDFSAVTDAQGRAVTIYDPLTTDANGNRQPFPGNIIPADRINPVGRALLSAMPLPSLHPDRDDGNVNLAAQARFRSGGTQGSAKIDYKLADRVGISGLFMLQRSHEPDANYFPDAPYAAPNFDVHRRSTVFVINQTTVVGPNTVLTLRAGQSRLDDNVTLPHSFDMRTLPGINPSFAGRLPLQKFPVLTLAPYSNTGNLGRSDTYYSTWSTNFSLIRLISRHSFKFGGEFRRIGARTMDYGQSAGAYAFNGFFTGSNGNGPAAASGNVIADLLLGYPSSGSVTLNSPYDQAVKYIGGFIQDDWRVSDRLTLNLGLRIEHETGLSDRDDRLVVGFDRLTASPLDVTIPADPIAGTPARRLNGGLIFAGKDGAPRHIGSPPVAKFAPRVAAAYAVNDATVLRAGYGLFWAPWQSIIQSSSGYSQSTVLQQNTLRPITSIDNPFPFGLTPISGNSLGLLTGYGSNITFPDSDRSASYVHQYSLDAQRQLGEAVSISVGYLGTTGRNLTWGGTGIPAINVNQVDPKYLSLADGSVNRLTELVPNPFFGHPAAGSFSTRATIQRNQLLRPFPQFGDIGMIHSTLARSQFHAGIVTLTARALHGVSGTMSYTFSRLNDNVFGQSNNFTNTPPILNNYTAIRWSEYFDPDAEYGRSRLDSPHKFVATSTIELPFGSDQRWLRGRVANAVAGGWSVAFVVQMQSGFPIGVSQQLNGNLLGASQRPNLVPGVDLTLPGSLADRLDTNAGDNQYLNPAAFSLAPASTFGDAPRILDVHSPGRNSTDIALAKRVALGGNRSASIRLDVINAFNNPWFLGAPTVFGNANFSRVTAQANYSRTFQITTRLSFSTGRGLASARPVAFAICPASPTR